MLNMTADAETIWTVVLEVIKCVSNVNNEHLYILLSQIFPNGTLNCVLKPDVTMKNLL